MLRVSTFDDGLRKLETVLLQMAPGDHLSIGEAVELSGLDEETCEFVLHALTEAGLMIPQPDASYRRCRLKMTEVDA